MALLFLLGGAYLAYSYYNNSSGGKPWFEDGNNDVREIDFQRFRRDLLARG